MGLNDAAKDKNGSDIIISAEGTIRELLKLKICITEGSSFVEDVFTSWYNFSRVCIVRYSSMKISSILQVYRPVSLFTYQKEYLLQR